MKSGMCPARRAQRARDVPVRRADLLQADDVPRVAAREPMRESPALGRADAVDVERDDAHARTTAGDETAAGGVYTRAKAGSRRRRRSRQRPQRILERNKTGGAMS